MKPRFAWLLTLGAAIACTVAAPSPPSRQQPTLYERIALKLARDPRLAQRLAMPPAELERAKWLLGQWEVSARVFATASTPERRSQGSSRIDQALGKAWIRFDDTYADGSDLTFLTFNAITQRWVSVTIDGTGNAVTTQGTGSIDHRLVFTGPPVSIVGETVRLRQTMEKRSDGEFHVLNEERLADGRWVALDEYSYRKKRP